MFYKLYKKMFLNPEVIKNKNEQYLLSQGARICKWLPCTEHTQATVSSQNMARRAAIVCGMFNIYMGAPTHVIKKWLEENELITDLSAEEIAIINKNESEISERELSEISWYIESLCAFLWAGSVLTELSPQKYVPDTLVNLLPNIQNGDSAEQFIKNIKIRSYGQIYQMLDLYYRAHWYTRDAGLCREDTKDFDIGIIEARRRALEWVFYATNDWDDIYLST